MDKLPLVLPVSNKTGVPRGCRHVPRGRKAARGLLEPPRSHHLEAAAGIAGSWGSGRARLGLARGSWRGVPVWRAAGQGGRRGLPL